MSNFIKFNFDTPVLVFREHSTNNKLQNIIKVLSSHENNNVFIFTIFTRNKNSTLTFKSGKFNPARLQTSQYLLKKNVRTSIYELFPVYNIQMFTAEDESALLLPTSSTPKSTTKPKQLRMKTNIKLSNLLNKNFKQFQNYGNSDISANLTNEYTHNVDYKQAFLSAGTINKHSSNYLNSRVENFKEEDENSQDYTDESESLVSDVTENESDVDIESISEEHIFDTNAEKTAEKQLEDISLNKKIKIINTTEISETFVIEQIKSNEQLTMKSLIGIVKNRYELKEDTIAKLKGILKKVAKLVAREKEKYLVLK